MENEKENEPKNDPKAEPPPWKRFEEDFRRYKLDQNFVPNKGRNFTPRYNFPSQRRFGRKP